MPGTRRAGGGRGDTQDPQEQAPGPAGHGPSKPSHIPWPRGARGPRAQAHALQCSEGAPRPGLQPALARKGEGSFSQGPLQILPSDPRRAAIKFPPRLSLSVAGVLRQTTRFWLSRGSRLHSAEDALRPQPPSSPEAAPHTWGSWAASVPRGCCPEGPRAEPPSARAGLGGRHPQ